MKKLFIIISILLISSLLFFVFIINRNERSLPQLSNEVNLSNRYTNLLNNIDINLVRNSDIDKSLSKCYFENNKIAGFSSRSIMDSPESYIMYWLLRIINYTENDQFDKKSLMQIAKLIDINKQNHNPLYTAFHVTGIYKELNMSSYDKDGIYKLLLDHYDKKSNLFFFDNKDENLNSKLSASIFALTILKNISSKFENLEAIKKESIYLLQEDKYFKSNTIKDKLNDTGINILLLCKNLNINKKDINNSSVFEKREKWFISLNNENLYNSLAIDPFSIAKLQSVKDICTYFRIPFILDKNFLTKILKEQNYYGGFTAEDDNFFIEPHYTYDIIELCKENGIEYPNINILYGYISDSIDSQFTKKGNATFLIEDNYYGICLANKFGYGYDKNKVKSLILSWKKQYIEEDNNISETKKLYEIYYLLLSMKEMNINYQNIDLIYNSLTNYLNNLVFDNSGESEIKNLDSYYIGLKIICLLNKQCPKELQGKIINFVNSLNMESDLFISIKISQLYSIVQYINQAGENRIDNDIIESMDMCLKKIFSNGGFKYSVYEKEPDIISTVSGLECVNIADIQKKESLKKFINELKDKELLFKASRSQKVTDLRIIYNTILATQFYIGANNGT